MLHLAAPNFVMGLGFGFVASPAIVAAQSSVGWERRGVATGATLFARSIGSAVGVAAFGAIANTVVRNRLGSEPTSLESLPGGVLDPAIHAVFLASFVVAADPGGRRGVHAQAGRRGHRLTLTRVPRRARSRNLHLRTGTVPVSCARTCLTVMCQDIADT